MEDETPALASLQICRFGKGCPAYTKWLYMVLNCVRLVYLLSLVQLAWPFMQMCGCGALLVRGTKLACPSTLVVGASRFLA